MLTCKAHALHRLPGAYKGISAKHVELAASATATIRFFRKVCAKKGVQAVLCDTHGPCVYIYAIQAFFCKFARKPRQISRP